MNVLTTIATSATIAAPGLAATAHAGSGQLTSNTNARAAGQPDGFLNHAPELPVADLSADSQCEITVLLAIMH